MDASEQVCERSYWACQDANYDVQGMVDAAGGVAERYTYTPYGQRTVYFSPGANDPDDHAATNLSRRVTLGANDVAQPYGLSPFGHQGLYHDEESRLVYNRARMLSPRLGRFMQRDTAGYVDGMSLYQYVRNDPINDIDPSGSKTCYAKGIYKSCVKRARTAKKKCLKDAEIIYKQEKKRINKLYQKELESCEEYDSALLRKCVRSLDPADS